MLAEAADDRADERKDQLYHSFKVTLPVLMGYIPLGMVFGLLLVDVGYDWFMAPLFSITVFAGAAQYVAIVLLASGAGLTEFAVATLLVNLRHSFYGLSMLRRYSDAGRIKPYLIFALTDETYALLTTTEPPEGMDRNRFYLLVSALDHSYWVIGSTIGALIGSLLTLDVTGMAFALTALFVVLTIEQYMSSRKAVPFIVALGAGVLALAWFGSDDMLLTSILIGTSVLLSYEYLRDGMARSTEAME